MPVYKGRTWCCYKECDAFELCSRAFSYEEQREAWKWWRQIGGKMSVITYPPVSIFLDKPTCFIES